MVTHRAFLATLLGVAAVFTSSAAATNEFFVYDNGLRGEKLETIEAKLDLTKAIGFDGISWRTDEPAQIKRLLEELKKRNLKLYGLYTELTLKDGKLIADPRLAEIITLCRGTDAFLWPYISSTEFPPSSPAGDAIAVDGLRQLAETAAANGLRVALYPHIGRWIHRVEDAVRVVKAINRPNVGVIFNLIHVLYDGAEDRIPAIIEEAAPYMFIATINGANEHLPRSPILPLGEGNFDVAPVMKKLRAVGYTGPIGLQCYRVPGDPATTLQNSMAAWRRMTSMSR